VRLFPAPWSRNGESGNAETFGDVPWMEGSGLLIASQDAEPFALMFLHEESDEFKSLFHLQVTDHT
jgi:hypothetical protein